MASAQNPDGASVSGGVRRILVVDDHEDIRRIVTWSLRKEFGEVELDEATNGMEALEKVREHTPDLIVLDVMMPGLDGMEVCRRIRSDPAWQRIPILMLTGKSDQESREAGFRVGTDDWIVKPFRRQDFCARARRLLESGHRPSTGA